MPEHYLRHPAVLGDLLLVVSDDDIFAADLAGGRAHRLTDGRTAASHPLPSPDGRLLAHTASEEGHPEVVTMPLGGGTSTRWTHLGASACVPRAWTGVDRLLVATNGSLPFQRDSQLVEVGSALPHPRPTGWGTAHEVAVADDGTVLIGRNTTNQGRWKRYRGGTSGQLWIDVGGTGTFRRILGDLEGDIASPMLIGDRAWFISDHEGVGNVYSCTLAGEDLTRHTDHPDFYARFAHTDGDTVVYAAGGAVYRLDPRSGRPGTAIDLRLSSPRTQRARRFVDPARWLQSYAVHPKGTHVALRVRGRPFTMPMFEGAPRQHGARDGVNHRLVSWLHDGEHLVLVADTDGEERLEVHGPHGLRSRLADLDLGVLVEVEPSPTDPVVAVTDLLGRLRVIDLRDGTLTEVADSPFGLDHPRWSPDGRWLAWSHRESNWYTASIRICRWAPPATDATAATGGRPIPVHHVTDARHANRAPDWDPGGDYLYWVASSRLVAVSDGVVFDHAFTHPDVVMAAVLTERGLPPLERAPHAPGARDPRPGPVPPAGTRAEVPAEDAVDVPPEEVGEVDPSATNPPGTEVQPPTRGLPVVTVDVDGLSERVVRLPFPTGRYRGVTGLHGAVLALGTPLRPLPLTPPKPGADAPQPGQMEQVSFATGRHEVLIRSLTSYDVSADRRTVVVAQRRTLRALKAGTKPPEGPGERTPRESGAIDLGRLSVAVTPGEEWRQIFTESWRMQRELFWHADMSGVDWTAVRDRYLGLVDRIASRAELSDLIWEMFGELGTGHAYERGGDHPAPPQAPLGHLGADVAFEDGAWRVERILVGDVTVPGRRPPLREPGVRVAEGAVLLHVDGVALDATTSPASLLVNQAGREVTVGVADPDPREVRIRPLAADTPLRYADWVARNRMLVADATAGRVGYVHIPDMGAAGYAEFHRQYVAEVYRDALIIDVRWNGGGNVSSLILEKLAGTRIGYQVRRTGALEPHPHHAPAGPLVALVNERCGSDGDIFAHAWKRLGLGPVVGTRTWGGVIGIQPRHSATDGTVTTQPGFAFWFDDVGFAVENRGTDPTHPVEVAPHDSLAGRDPQLEAAMELADAALRARGPLRLPDLASAPMLAAPPLPPRTLDHGSAGEDHIS